eukprot:3495382-Pleurochrysis_carterae.AAC.3
MESQVKIVLPGVVLPHHETEPRPERRNKWGERRTERMTCILFRLLLLFQFCEGPHQVVLVAYVCRGFCKWMTGVKLCDHVEERPRRAAC